MDKQQTYDYLDAHGVSYEATEHAAVYNMAELETVELPYPDRDAKDLFVRVVELWPRPWRSWSGSRGRLISCRVLRRI